MANTAQLFRRQSSRDLNSYKQRSIDNLELKVNWIRFGSQVLMFVFVAVAFMYCVVFEIRRMAWHFMRLLTLVCVHIAGVTRTLSKA